jgi:hypothetical protein
MAMNDAEFEEWLTAVAQLQRAALMLVRLRAERNLNQDEPVENGSAETNRTDVPNA